MIKFMLNDQLVSSSTKPDERLLDVIRDEFKLSGTKEGCREGDCGACLVLLGEIENNKLKYKPINSCLFPFGNVNGKHIITIEGINVKNLNPLQRIFIEENSVQCGFCTPGFILSLYGFLLVSDTNDYKEALRALDGNVCRCTGYASIKKAVDRFIKEICKKEIIELNEDERIKKLLELEIIPDYFLTIKTHLNKISPEVKGTNQFLSENQILVSGGTDLYVQHSDGFEDKNIVLLKDSVNQKIYIQGDFCYIDAFSCIEDIYRSKILKEILPEIRKTFQLIASTPIRYRATLGGNLVNASPIGDLSVVFLSLKSDISLQFNDKTRILPLSDFFLDYKKINKDKLEILKWLRFPLPGINKKLSFEKISKRTHLDIASVNSAMSIKYENGIVEEIDITAGGVAPVPKLFNSPNETLLGQKISNQTVNNTVKNCLEEISPITDMRGSANYKKILLRQLLYAHFEKLLSDQIVIEELI